VTSYDVHPVARVESPLTDRSTAPKQGDEGAPPARVVFTPEFHRAAADLRPGDRPSTGVFSTRSPDRPNPIGLHVVTVTGLEAIDGTPVLDVKPVLGEVAER